MEDTPVNGDAGHQQEKFKFSISGKSKASQRKRDAKGEGHGDPEKAVSSKEMIVALQGKDVVAADGTVSTKGALKAIPKLENTWKPNLKPRGGMPSALDEMMRDVEDGDRFEVAPEEAEKDGGPQYGLSVREKPKATDEGNASRGVPSVSLRDLETQKLREDLGSLPDEASMDAYESMPIESFGEALLRGMGWKEGKGIGRNGKGVAEAVEYVPRPNRLGLGATPKQKVEEEKKYVKPGEQRGQKKDLVAPVGADGKVRHVKKISEQLVERDRGEVREGKVVVIVGGRHEGLEARVRSVVPLSSKSVDGVRKWPVRLLRSEEDVEVWEDHLVDKRVWEEKSAQAQALEEARRRQSGQQSASGSREAVHRQEEASPEHKDKGRSRDYRAGNDKNKTRRGDEESRPSERQSKRARGLREEGEEDSAAPRHHRGEEEAYAREHDKRLSVKMDMDGRRPADGPVGNDRGTSRDMDGRRPADAPAVGNSRGTSRDITRRGMEEEAPPMRPKGGREEEAPPPKQPKGQSWLMPHIRVRIVSRQRAGGRLYLSKGVIVDVVTPHTCDVLLDGASGSRKLLVEGVGTEELETALPKRGGRVVLLRGEHRGERGKLLERNSERGDATVQLAQSFEIITFGLDDVAEFVGDEGAYEG